MHDLTYNLREGYEAEAESENNGHCLALPSISEDDENQAEDGLSNNSSPRRPSITRSPVHGVSTASPARHAKLLQKSVLVPFLTYGKLILLCFLQATNSYRAQRKVSEVSHAKYQQQSSKHKKQQEGEHNSGNHFRRRRRARRDKRRKATKHPEFR